MHNRTTLNDEDSTPATPAWLTSSCPTWCAAKHQDRDHVDDRNHHGRTRITPLLTMNFVNCGPPSAPSYRPIELMCDLVQHHREAEPRINIGDTNDEFSDYLSLGEAEQFAGHLLTLVTTGRTAARQPAPGGAAGCRPWCVRHDDVNGLCNGPAVPAAPGSVGLTHVDDEGPRVWAGDQDLTADEAEELAAALLVQAARARQTIPQ